jgi:pseudouridine-5'-phosphate glycosidase
MIVCSGFKSILDIPATLEAAETRGVAIVGYQTCELPAFTSFSSGLPLEHRVESAAEASALLCVHRSLALPGAVVLANPVPENEAIDRSEMNAALDAALDEARRHGISGKALSPFLLDSIRRTTEGKSLRANMALLVANARLAAEIATCMNQSLPCDSVP